MKRFVGYLCIAGLFVSGLGLSSATAEITQRDYRGRTYYYKATEFDYRVSQHNQRRIPNNASANTNCWRVSYASSICGVR